jgi:hypothetical protein
MRNTRGTESRVLFDRHDASSCEYAAGSWRGLRRGASRYRAKDISYSDVGANGRITRANAARRVFSHATPPTRSRVIAAAVATCGRGGLACPTSRVRRHPNARTACEIVPSLPARFCYSALHSDVFSRWRACGSVACDSRGLLLMRLRLSLEVGHWLQSALANTSLITALPRPSTPGRQLELCLPCGQVAT